MSDFSKITRHPVTGRYEKAAYRDDYFGTHLYGVQFPSDLKIYPLEQVNKAQLEEFWAADVILAFKQCRPFNQDEDIEVLAFLNELQIQYKARWKRDKLGGEGAVDNLRKKRGK